MSKRGVALYLVLAVLLVVVILTDLILNIMSSQSKLANHQVRRIQAYYAAQGAINYAFAQLRMNATGWVPTATAITIHMCRNNTDPLYSGAPDWLEPSLPFMVNNVTITIDPMSGAGLFPISAKANYTAQ